MSKKEEVSLAEAERRMRDYVEYLVKSNPDTFGEQFFKIMAFDKVEYGEAD